MPAAILLLRRAAALVNGHPFRAAMLVALLTALTVIALRTERSREVPILMYHGIESTPTNKWSVTPEAFDEQLSQLQSLGFQTVLPAELAAAAKDHAALPSRPIVITFDDGYESMKSFAAPLLKKHGFRAIVYLVTDQLGESAESRKMLDGQPCLTWPEVRELNDEGVLAFGSHSHHHIKLDTVPDPQTEIASSTAELVSRAGITPDSFSFPFCTYSKKLLKQLAASGYTTAMTCDERPAELRQNTHLFELPRYWVTSTTLFPLDELTQTKSAPSSLIRSIPWSSVGHKAFAAALLLLALAAITSRECSANILRSVERTVGSERRVVILLAAANLAVLVAVLLFHFAFQTSAYDLRLHEELVRNTWQGKPMYSDLLGRSFLGIHTSFIFVLFSLPYVIWQSPTWLLVMQSGCMFAASWFLWRLARAHNLTRTLSLILALGLVLCRGNVNGQLAGFHQEVVAIAMLLGFFWAEKLQHWKTAAVFLLLALFCREDVALPLAVYGGLRIFERGHRASGGVVAAVSCCWFLLMLLVVIPHFAVAGRMDNLNRWAQFGSTVPEIAWGLLTHPWVVLSAPFTRGSISLFAPLLLLPLLDPKTLLPLLLPLTVAATSSFPEQVQFNGAYAAQFLPYIFVGAVRVLGSKWAAKLLVNPRVAAILTLLLLWQNARQIPLPEFTPGLLEAHAGLRTIEPELQNSEVFAQSSILPHLSWPRETKVLDLNPPPKFKHLDAILLSEAQNPWPATRFDLREYAYTLRQSGKWKEQKFGTIRYFSRKTRN